MTESSTNAMDQIEVRRLTFDTEKIESQNPVWSYTHPLFSIFINALSVHIPYFERYLVWGLRRVKNQINNERLQSDVVRIIGQEGQHAKNFIATNQFLAKRYPEVEQLDAQARAYFREAAEHNNQKETLGFIAGYETFTYLGGMIILQRYDQWMKDAEPVMRSIWVWHQVEEVEHGAVAFDAYRYFYGDHEYYRKWMVVKAFAHIALQTAKAYIPMVRKEGYFKKPVSAVKAMGFFLNMAGRLAAAALPVLSKKYHPRHHPLCSSEQSPVAVSWTKLLFPRKRCVADG